VFSTPSGSEEFLLDLNKLSKLEYLNSCIKESFRLMPPANHMPRATGKGGLVVNGEYIPQGNLYLSLYL
jgi:cytochrome P450